MEHGITCPPFSDSLINEQLQRIFTSPSFSVSDILKRFLQYIVQETLAGRSNMIKEYTIGVNVLNKPADFKPQHDAIVRIHAGRLRRAINKYYKESGMDDLIEISIPKGSYVPLFGKQGLGYERAESKAQERPDLHFPATTRIAVMPFRCYETDHGKLAFADSLGQQLSEEFGHFPDFSVVGYYAARQAARKIADIRELASLYGARFAITGNLQFEGKKMRAGVQLTDLADGEQIWADRYEFVFETLSSFAIQDKIVGSVVGVLADFYGLIVQQAARKFLREKAVQTSVSKAMIWYSCFHTDLNETSFVRALRAMDLAVKENPEYDLAWAWLGEFFLHSHLFRYPFKENSILMGMDCAHKALRLNPRSVHAYITLAWANLYLKNKPAALEAIEQAKSINPNAASTMGSAACIMICLGEYERGMKWLSKAIHLNPSYPPAFNLCMALYYLKKKNYEAALQWSEKMNSTSLIWLSIIRITALANLATPKSRMTLSEVPEEEIRELSAVTRETLGKSLLDNELVDRLFKGLKGAKLPLLTVA